MNELEYSDFLKGETDLEREAGLILEHHGIKGQRWGVRRTPEQLGHKTGGGLKGAISLLKKKRAAAKKKAAKKKAAIEKAAKKKAEAEAAEAAKKKEEEDAKIKEKLLTSTDPVYIYQHRDLLDTKELQDRIDRIMKEQKIKELIPDPNAKRKKVMKTGEDFLKSAASMADSVGKLYDTYNKVTGKKNDSGGGGKKDKKDKPKQQNDKPEDNSSKDKTNSSDSGKKDDKDGKNKPKAEQRQEKFDAKTTAKAAEQFFNDPGIQALLALGMVAPVDREKINERAKQKGHKS